jgi:inner membrane protein
MGLFDLPVADHWAWLILGALLITAELLAPGFFLMWIGGAAIIVGIATLILPIGSEVQLILFAVIALATVYAARRWFVTNAIVSDDPELNNRGARLTGEVVTVVEAIEGGRGRVKVGDSVWSARGEDAPVGAKLRVTGIDGSVLTVGTL